jgi:hypothetical protein
MHHKPKNRGHMLTTKNIHFVKLSKCVMDFITAFLSSRWSKNIYGTSNLGPDERVIPPRKCMNYRYYRSEITGTTGPRRFGANMNYRYYQWMVVGGVVWCENELPVLPVLDRYYRWSLTRSTGRCLFRI